MSSADHLEIALGDKVEVKLKKHTKNKKNQNIGTVLFYGAVESHKDTWFGISFDHTIGKNDGTYKNRKYFKSKPKHGCFVQHHQITKIISVSKQKHHIPCNSYVTLPGYGHGKVRFAGIAAFNPGVWYGIELDVPLDTDAIHSIDTGSADGSVSDIKYFECAVGHALFRRKEDIFAMLSGKKPSNDIVIQKNIKPSLTEKKRFHSNTTTEHPNKENKNKKGTKGTKPNKKDKGTKMQRSESEPRKDDTRLPMIESLARISDVSNSEHDDEIKDNTHNDHSNETKEDEEQYEYDLKLDEMDGDEDMETKEKKKKDTKEKKRTLQVLANHVLVIAESDTSDIDEHEAFYDTVAAAEMEMEEKDQEKLAQHKMNSMMKSKSVPPPSSDTTPRSIYSNCNTSAYIEHLQDVATASSPKSHTPNTRKYSKSIKKLKHEFLNACNDTKVTKHKHNKTGKDKGDKTKGLKVNISKDKAKELKLAWKEHSTPVKFGDLSLEYSTSSPTVDDIATDDDDEDAPTPMMPLNASKSVQSPMRHKKFRRSRTPKPIDVPQSTGNSPVGDRDRALTFPTMALNTDNATKISAATPHQQKFKVIVLGQSRVGKTAIIRRFVKDKFFSSYKMTLGAAQWHFKCEVPIDLIEEIERDNNMLRSMASFLDQVQEENDDIKQEIPPLGGFGIATQSLDPFDAEDEMAEFGNAYDYGMNDNDDYQLNNMETTIDTEYLSSFNYNSASNHDHHSRSITDYGQFTIPSVEATAKDTRKISMKLQITMDIVDMGFHPTEEELFDDINSIILVVDFSKKSSINDAIDKYEMFCKNSLFFNSKKARRRSRRSRTRSHSNPRGSMVDVETEEREYIPLIIAVNKCDKKRQFKKNEIKKIISKRLQPIIDEYFPENDEEKANKDDENNNNGDDDDEKQTPRRRPRNFANTTLLQPPNLSFIYNEGDAGSDSEYETEDESEYEDDDDDEDNESDKGTKQSSDLLNAPDTERKKKRRKKSSKKRKQKKRNQNDIRFIDIIQCSAKTGKNIEKLFGSCIKKTIPSKLTKSVTHKRNKTTAHVTAPIWLRQVVAEFEKDSDNENHPFWDHSPRVSDVDDNFTFLGDEL